MDGDRKTSLISLMPFEVLRTVHGRHVRVRPCQLLLSVLAQGRLVFYSEALLSVLESPAVSPVVHSTVDLEQNENMRESQCLTASL